MKKKNQPSPREQFETDAELSKRKLSHTILKSSFDPTVYDIDDRSSTKIAATVAEARTVADVMHLVESKKADVEGLIMHVDKDGFYTHKRLKQDKLIEAFKSKKPAITFKEAKHIKSKENFDGSFDYGNGSSVANAGLIGDDYTPLLGGPFNKQLYFYDYLKMCSLSFFAYNHDPFARAIVHITRDFVLGRGFRIDSDNLEALAYWRAFEEANDLQNQMDQVVRESSIYGETLLWWLPNNETKIVYQTKMIPTGSIPRVRLMDPSGCWEIVTYPEDITRVLNYTFIFPTQYQLYPTTNGDDQVPSSKFIIQQIPADQMQHFKLNSVSNEKRGRSDLFPVLGDLKRLRDAVDYSLAGMQKVTAWAIDTTVKGNDSDLDSYVASQEALGTIAPAGSEFVHTDAVKREYLGNTGSSSGGDNTAFDWALNKIAAGTQIPVSYFGIHASGGQTRASALVGTEPVAKKMRARQIWVENIIRAMWTRVMDHYGIKDADCEVTLPELLTQDRSAKIKDLKLAEDCGYITRERAATIVAKELEITEYDYDQEKVKIAAEQAPPVMPTTIAPLTAPAAAPSGAAPAGGAEDADKAPPTANTSSLKRALSMGRGA